MTVIPGEFLPYRPESWSDAGEYARYTRAATAAAQRMLDRALIAATRQPLPRAARPFVLPPFEMPDVLP